MIRHIFALCLLLSSFGAVYAQVVPDKYWYNYPTSVVKASSGEGACSAYISSSYASPGYVFDHFEFDSGSTTKGGCWAKKPPSTTVNKFSSVWQATCPIATPHFSATACTADPPPELCKAGPVGNYDVTMGYVTGPDGGSARATSDGVASPEVAVTGSYCMDGCNHLYDSANQPQDIWSSCGIEPNPTSGGFYKLTCRFAMKRDGAQCNGTEKSPDIPPPPGTNDGSGKCPAGSVPSGQDRMGTTICIGTAKPTPPPTTTTEKPEVTTPNPDGGSTTVKQTTTTNGDGSSTTTTTTTVTAADGTKATTVDMQTTAKPAGGPGTPDKPEDKSDLCKQNPHLTICQNSQVLGQCGEISCTGDAIQCATLRAASAMECRDKADREDLAKSPLKAAGDAILSGNDPMQGAIDAALEGSIVDLSNPNLDTSGFIGGGACFAPMTINVMGHVVTQSFASVCENILPLRYAIMLMASIISYLIVGRTVLGN